MTSEIHAPDILTKDDLALLRGSEQLIGEKEQQLQQLQAQASRLAAELTLFRMAKEAIDARLIARYALDPEHDLIEESGRIDRSRRPTAGAVSED
jgi:hypothetical protein